MRVALAIVAALLLLAATADAQVWIMSPTGGSSPTGAGGKTGGAPACSNSFDFSQACNSQYLG